MKVTLEIEVTERSKRFIENSLGLENMTEPELVMYLAHQVYRFMLNLEDRTIVVEALKVMRHNTDTGISVPP